MLYGIWVWQWRRLHSAADKIPAVTRTFNWVAKLAFLYGKRVRGRANCSVYGGDLRIAHPVVCSPGAERDKLGKTRIPRCRQDFSQKLTFGRRIARARTRNNEGVANWLPVSRLPQRTGAKDIRRASNAGGAMQRCSLPAGDARRTHAFTCR